MQKAGSMEDSSQRQHCHNGVHCHLHHSCPCTVLASSFHQLRMAVPSFTRATHIPGVICRCSSCLAGQGISPYQLLQICCLAAELQRCFSCFNNEKVTLASHIKASLTSSGSERNVCIHRYVHACGGKAKTSLLCGLGLCFYNHSHSVQIRDGQCPWEVT